MFSVFSVFSVVNLLVDEVLNVCVDPSRIALCVNGKCKAKWSILSVPGVLTGGVLQPAARCVACASVDSGADHCLGIVSPVARLSQMQLVWGFLNARQILSA